MDQPRHQGALNTRRALTLALSLALLLAPVIAGASNKASRSVYHALYTSTAHSDLRALFGLPAQPGADAAGLVHDIDTRLEFDVEQVSLDVPGEQLLALRLRQPKMALRIDGADATAHGEAIAAQLGADTLLVTRDEDGLVAGLRLPAGMDEQARAYARAVVAALQFSRPRAGARSWETREDDQAGIYRARYERSGKEVVRTRLAYEPTHASMPGQVTVTQLIEPAGSVRASFDRAGALLTLDGTETQRVLVTDKVIATGETRVQMRRVSAAEPLADAVATAMRARLQVGVAERLSAAALVDSSDESMHRRELGADTIDTLLARLGELAKQPPGSSAATTLHLKFKALVALQPETSARLGQEIVRASGSSAMLTLAQALGSIGHAQAQAALVAAIRSLPNDSAALSALLPVLGSVAKPTAATIEAMQQLAVSTTDVFVASTARLALGTVAKTGATQAPEHTAALITWLRARLGEARDERGRRDYLLALGNSASPAVQDDALRFARDPVPGVRAAAMSALRWTDTAPARAQLLSSLAKDEDADVRLAAAQVLGTRRMDEKSFAAQRRAFETDQDAQVRLALLQNLWAALAQFPEARAVAETARKDESKAVRDAAERMR